MGLTPARTKAALSIILLASIPLASLVSVPSAQGFQTSGQYASTVLGEPNFVSSNNEVSANGLFRPFRLAFDSQGDLWVADENNNRVLEFKPPFTDGMSASLEIGQANFTSLVYTASQARLNEPVGLTFDSQGDLWIMDSYNDRVLEFKPPFTSGMNASLELGQPAGPREFTSSAPSSGPSGLNAPVDAAFDEHGDLWVADRGNDRVLEFKPPFTSGMNASSVIGQDNLTSATSFFFASPNTLFGPNGLAFDRQGDLWVADESFNRVLEFAASSLGTNNPPAVLEIGQHPGSKEFYTSGLADNRSGLADPLGLAFDPEGNLWVSDRANNRILEFDTPFTDGMNASAVVGTPPGPKAFDSNVTGLTQTLFANPLGIAFDPGGNLWVADQLNNRILEFSAAALETAGENVNIPTTTDLTGLNVTASGDACYRLAEQTVCHLAVDQTSETGVRTDIIGIASGSTANVFSSYLGTQAPAVGLPPLLSSPAPSYYGLSVTGLANGTATVCVAQPSATGMAYYSGGAWAYPSTTSKSASTICGTIPLSAVASLAVIGVGKPSHGTSGSLGLVVAVTTLVVVVAAGTYVLNKKRAPPQEDDTEEEQEPWLQA